MGNKVERDNSLRDALDAAEARVASLEADRERDLAALSRSEAAEAKAESENAALRERVAHVERDFARLNAEETALRERVASYEAASPMQAHYDAGIANADDALREKLAVAEANLVASAEAQQRITDDATRLAEHMGKRIGIAVAALREISHINRYNDSGEWVDVADEALKKLGVE